MKIATLSKMNTMNMNGTDVTRYLPLEFSKILSKEPAVTHFFTTRSGGVSEGAYSSMNLGLFCGDNPVSVDENRKILCEALDIAPRRLIVPREVHGNNVYKIEENFLTLSDEEQQTCLSACDALITAIPRVCPAVTTADCVPVLLYDKKEKSIAAVHAGWKGVVKEILPITIQQMEQAYHSRPENMIAVTGPAIGVKSYQVNQDVVDAFQTVFNEKDMQHLLYKGNGNTLFIDLKKALFIQCQKAGILVQNIEIHPDCTYLQKERYFSARRDSIHSGRMLSGIMLHE